MKHVVSVKKIILSDKQSAQPQLDWEQKYVKLDLSRICYFMENVSEEEDHEIAVVGEDIFHAIVQVETEEGLI